VPPLSIVTATLPEVRLTDAYQQTIEVTGGKPPYVFSIVSGALPDGIVLSPGTGELSGVAGTPGHARFTLRVADAAKATTDAMLGIYVIPDLLSISTKSLPPGKQGTPYDHVLLALGGVPPLSWSLANGSLPMGVEIQAAGRISGTPASFGSFDFTVTVHDVETSSRSQVLHVTLSSLDPMIETATLAKARVGSSYSVRLAASGGDPPYDWSIASGVLPAGIDLSADGLLTGAPTEAGTFTFSVLVTDATNHQDMKELTLRSLGPLIISTPALPQVIVGRPYDTMLRASGGQPPYVWTLGGGTLPTGIVFESSGRLHGMSAQISDYLPAFRVRDADGFQTSAEFVLHVSDRFIYDVRPMATIPAICTTTLAHTATTVSYRMIPIDVPESYQILNANITVDIPFNGANDPLRIVLFGPDGSQSVLCGNGANDMSTRNSGGRLCTERAMTGGISMEFTDSGTPASRPESPLLAFAGLNPKGRWTLAVGVTIPNCSVTGVVRSVQLSLQDDRSTAPYLFVRGYQKNNLVIDPMVRICSPLPPPNARCGGIDQHELFLSAAAYTVGPNGMAEGGAGDDVQLTTPMVWSWVGAPIADVTLTPDGHITAGRYTGMSVINVSGGGLSANLTLRSVPPDWSRQVRGF
jgi:hypothetical protein